MVNKKYKDYIASPQWQAKRKAVFSRYGRRCYACFKRSGPIHVHHLTYDRFGRELIEDLLPLCAVCHKNVTKIYKRNRKANLRLVTMNYVKFRRKQLFR